MLFSIAECFIAGRGRCVHEVSIPLYAFQNTDYLCVYCNGMLDDA